MFPNSGKKKKKMLRFFAFPLPSPEHKTTEFFTYQSVGKEVSNLTKKKRKKRYLIFKAVIHMNRKWLAVGVQDKVQRNGDIYLQVDLSNFVQPKPKILCSFSLFKWTHFSDYTF